jgi:hypothetical protein
MAELIVDGSDLVLHLTPVQRMVSFHKDLRVPLSSVRAVTSVDKPWLALRGRRMAGTALRGVAAMGTWTHSDRLYDFCVVRGQQTAVQIDLTTGRFERWLVCVPPGTDARAEADRLADAAGIARS